MPILMMVMSTWPRMVMIILRTTMMRKGTCPRMLRVMIPPTSMSKERTMKARNNLWDEYGCSIILGMLCYELDKKRMMFRIRKR